MGSAPVTGRGKNRPGIQAAAPPGPWAEWPLPTAEPDPEAGGKASGAWNPVPPCHGLGFGGAGIGAPLSSVVPAATAWPVGGVGGKAAEPAIWRAATG